MFSCQDIKLHFLEDDVFSYAIFQDSLPLGDPCGTFLILFVPSNPSSHLSYLPSTLARLPSLLCALVIPIICLCD